jgi:hypothetical protein
MGPPNAKPLALQDRQVFARSVDKIQLTLGKLLVEGLVTFEGRSAIVALFNDTQAIKLAPIAFGVGFERLDDQPAIGVSLTHGVPVHCRSPVSVTVLSLH